MKETILVNRNTSAYAVENQEATLMYVKIQKRNFEDCIKIRGYIYLNQIYENLGCKWNPLNDNPYCTDIDSFYFNVRSVDDGFEIDICW